VYVEELTFGKYAKLKNVKFIKMTNCKTALLKKCSLPNPIAPTVRDLRINKTPVILEEKKQGSRALVCSSLRVEYQGCCLAIQSNLLSKMPPRNSQATAIGSRLTGRKAKLECNRVDLGAFRYDNYGKVDLAWARCYGSRITFGNFIPNSQ
jgi:hypothetical protein